NVVERAVILTETDAFLVDENWLKAASMESARPKEGLSVLADRELEMIEAALAESHGRISGPSGAAAKLGVPRQTLETKIRRLGIVHSRTKPPSPLNFSQPFPACSEPNSVPEPLLTLLHLNRDAAAARPAPCRFSAEFPNRFAVTPAFAGSEASSASTGHFIS